MRHNKVNLTLVYNEIFSLILIIICFFVNLPSNEIKMNENRLMQQVTAIFSTFMVVFYLGVGIFLLYYNKLNYIDKAVRVIMGSTFIFYGLYRAYRAYVKIVEVFFTDDDDDLRTKFDNKES